MQRRHTEDIPCRVPFCKECLQRIKDIKTVVDELIEKEYKIGVDIAYDKEPSKLPKDSE